MKNKTNFLRTLALLVMSFFVSTAFGQVSVTTNSFSYNSQICLKASTFKVFDLRVENLDSAKADSGYVEYFNFQHGGNPFSFADSIYLYINDGGKLTLIDMVKFANGELKINFNKWVKAKQVINLIGLCRSRTVTEETHMWINLYYFNYSNRNGSHSPWLGLSSPPFYAVDCDEPWFDVDVTSFGSKKCYNLGDTAYAFSIKAESKADSTLFKGVDFLFDEEPWFATIDSVFIFDGKKLLAKGKVVNREFSLKFNKLLADSTSSFFKVYAKASSRGQLALRVWRYSWEHKGRQKYWDRADVSGPYEDLQDCNPKVKLQISTNNNSKTVCSKDRIGIAAHMVSSVYDAHKVEYFVNKKLFAIDSNFTDPNWFPYHDNVKTSLGKNIFMVKVTDVSGRIAYDYDTITVIPSPQLKISVSSTEMCDGDNVIFKSDTVGLALWALDAEDLSNKSKTTTEIFDGGKHYFSGVANNNCKSDTSFMIYKVPAQKKPTIIIQDWIIGSDVSADSFAWNSYDPTTQQSTALNNSNKMFMSNLPAGIYAVRAFNKYGCSKISALKTYSGYIAKDSLPHVRLLISSPHAGNNYCSTDEVIASRSVLQTVHTIAKEEWYLNGVKIPFLKNQLFDGMQYPIPMDSGVVKLKIVVTDAIGKKAMDSVILNIYKSPKALIVASANQLCSGNEVIIIADITKLSQWAWGTDKPSKSYTNKLRIDKGGSYTFTAVSKEGCTSDTTVLITELPKQEKLFISSYDTILWTNVKAFKIEWYRNDTLLNGAKNQFMTSKKTGFHSVQAWSVDGCSSVSDLMHFVYVAPKKQAVPKDTSSVVIGSENPSTVFCEGEFNPTLTLVNVKKEDVSKVEWFVESTPVFSCKDIQLCGLTPKYFWLTSGIRKIVVRVTLFNKSIESDTVYVTIVGPQKTKLSVTGNLTECSSRTVVVNVQNNSNYKSVTWSNGSSSKNITLLDPNGSFFATTIDYNGCVANTDTVMLKTLVLPKPVLIASKCKLYADIDWDKKGGYWNWVKNDTVVKVTQIPNYVTEGEALWKVQFVEKTGCASETSASVFVRCITGGIDKLTSKSLKIYPNPAIESFTIESTQEKGLVEVADLRGSIVATTQLVYGKATIYRENLAKGIYLVRVGSVVTELVFL
jgi:hypothetical protein